MSPATMTTRRLFTRADWRAMAEAGVFGDEALELIDGEVAVMAPEGPDHASLGGRIGDILRPAFGEGWHVRTNLPMAGPGICTEIRPDVAVVKGGWRDYMSEHPSTAGLVVEVSRSSLAFALGDKAGIYAAMGVREYWVVDMATGRLVVHRDPVIKADSQLGHAYQSVSIVAPADGAVISPLEAPGTILQLIDLL